MAYKSPLEEMAKTTPTQFWNDNCSISDLNFAIEHGAVGATTNPVIVGQVLDTELDRYAPRIESLIQSNPRSIEDDIAWMLNEEMAIEGAKLLEPVYKESRGACGYISIQTNAKYYRNAQLITDQAVHFKSLASNIMVKMPVSCEGVKGVEESTFNGVNINATVSFTVPQAVAVAEAVERGLNRRAEAGLDNSGMHPVCTIMVGRIQDWLAEVAKTEGIEIDDIALQMSGVAVFKNAYRIFKERGYRCRLLAAAYRNDYHWTEFIGGDVSLTIPPKWIRRFAESDHRVENRMDIPVDPAILERLSKLEDFRRAYEPDGIAVEDFDTFGATRKTLLQFLTGYEKMVGVIRSFMIKD